MDLYAVMPPLMFAALVVFLLSGYPVAFSLGAVGIVFGFLGIALDLFPPALLKAMPDRIFGIMSNQLLLAIPFFTFMGIILEKSGLAEDLLDTMGRLFGPLRGGLALSVVFVGAILAATTGVVAASVMAMGLISLPVMLKYGYNPRVASGVILGSATLAQIIPPSVVLIVLADQLGVSVGDMYVAALVPSALTVGLYFLYVIYLALFRPQWVPALPPRRGPRRGRSPRPPSPSSPTSSWPWGRGSLGGSSTSPGGSRASRSSWASPSGPSSSSPGSGEIPSSAGPSSPWSRPSSSSSWSWARSSSASPPPRRPGPWGWWGPSSSPP